MKEEKDLKPDEYQEQLDVLLDLKLEKQTTSNGFPLFKFYDASMQVCSLQQSSVMDYKGVWLGVDYSPHTTVERWYDEERKEESFEVKQARMHLSQKQAEGLIKKLQQFVKDGTID